MPQRLPWIMAAAVALGFGLTAPALAVDVDGPDDCLRDLQDLGDAPDGLQPTLAYPGVFGHFPTCFMPTPPGTQEVPCGVPTCPPPTYTGYVLHRQGPGGYWLGCGPPMGAPQGIDSDPTGKFNDNGGVFTACDLQPPTTTVDTWVNAFGITFGQDEGYGDSDAGLAASPTFYTGLVTSVTFQAYNCGAPRDVLLNILVDWSHDGDWCDNVLLPGGACVTEWPVINQVIHLPTGCSTITSPSFGAGATPGPAWMRITSAAPRRRRSSRGTDPPAPRSTGSSAARPRTIRS